MKMGGRPKPFGVDHERVPALVRRIIDAGAEWRGLHIFAGCQALDAEALIELQRDTVALAAPSPRTPATRRPRSISAAASAFPISHGDQPLDIDAVGAALARHCAARRRSWRDTSFAIELGRWLVGEAGVYLTRIVDRKESRGKTFLVTDGGLHHQLAASRQFRPAAAPQLSRSPSPAASAPSRRRKPAIVGCLCTPLDLLADEVAAARGRGRRPGRDLLRRRLWPQRQPAGLPQPAPGEGDAWSRGRCASTK